ncbi:MAG: ABC transporter ATP-binding protein [Gammaproteobacteria bacterium]|nr:ABC transporter ATP-binding protein [Gammaproteobacteria bacterium]MDE0410610.1 ABC transporter ATP-binding protein [Gammaproteobacteria bacterium]
MENRSGVQISIKDLTHRYTAKSPITFDKVNVSADPGEALVIIGRSGCGKSTLLHILAGLLDKTSGTVQIDGKDVRAPSSRWIMMFQAPHLFPWMTVEQNVGTGLRFARWPENKIKNRVNEVIGLVHLEEFSGNNTQDLSGGQQQRVALARSLVMEPDMLLLDEPFSALDAFTRATLQKDVRAISKQLGFNLVMVTHDIDEAVIMADRALVMAGSPGKIVHDFKVDLDDPRERQDPSVQEMRARLMQIFHEAAGVPAASDDEDSDAATDAELVGN